MLSHEEKIMLMKQALSIEVSGFRSHEAFNSFYSQDLIIFGMTNNIPEAVRLGEHMLGENGSTLSFEMAKAVKAWRLQNNAAYMSSMKKTGPVNTLSVYMNNRPQGSQGYTPSSIVNMDDPYWQEFYERNYRT